MVVNDLMCDKDFQIILKPATAKPSCTNNIYTRIGMAAILKT